MIICVIGTRPEAIKMAPVIMAFKKLKQGVATIFTGQHRHMVDQVLPIFDVKINRRFRAIDGTSLSEFLALTLQRLDRLFRKVKPDAVLAQGDTLSVVAASMASFLNKIPFGHIEAGLRTYDMSAPYPEEWNRHIASIGATWHFAPTHQAAQNLINERIVTGGVYTTGNTVIDALKYVLLKKPPQLALPLGDERPYILVTCHRRENQGTILLEICDAIRNVAAAHSEIRFIYPVHPNPAVHDTVYAELKNIENVQLVPPMNYVQFVHAMNSARLILSDSGGIQEEAPLLGKRVLVLRDSTERPESLAVGCELVGTDHERIYRAIVHELETPQAIAYTELYGDGTAGEKIANIILTSSPA